LRGEGERGERDGDEDEWEREGEDAEDREDRSGCAAADDAAERCGEDVDESREEEAREKGDAKGGANGGRFEGGVAFGAVHGDLAHEAEVHAADAGARWDFEDDECGGVNAVAGGAEEVHDDAVIERRGGLADDGEEVCRGVLGGGGKRGFTTETRRHGGNVGSQKIGSGCGVWLAVFHFAPPSKSSGIVTHARPRFRQ
jgi:hypothetical protein